MKKIEDDSGHQVHKIKKGLDLHLAGVAREEKKKWESKRFYVTPSDFYGLSLKMLVREGDEVQVGTPVMCDKQDERVVVVSPVCGRVDAIVRGERRVVETVVIEAEGQAECRRQVAWTEPATALEHRGLLLRCGYWPFLRQRPYAVVPSPAAQPKAVFVSCFDSAPLAPDTAFLLQNREADFLEGIRRLQALFDEKIPFYLSLRAGQDASFFENIAGTEIHCFQGPHPAGNVGTQIHRIAPLDKGESVWYVHPQDVAAIGRLFLTHTLGFEKVFALTGPAAEAPCYYESVWGADVSALVAKDAQLRIRAVSGNVLTGKTLDKFPALRFYDPQLTLLPEGGEREFLGWLLPGMKKWSLSHTFLAWLTKKKTFAFDTSLHGGRRTLIMSDAYDEVFPFDLLPVELLKACLTADFEQMEELGIYEVDAEDFALCDVVCPSKTECQAIVREAMEKLRKENGTF